jgi:cell division cycle protein 37
LEREEKEDKEVEQYQQKNKEDQARINVIKSRLKRVADLSTVNQDDADDASFEDTEALQIELDELQNQINTRNKRIEEINTRRQWNIDNICKVKDEKTIVNSIQSKSLKEEVPNDLVVESLENDEEPVKAAPTTSGNPSAEKAAAAPAATTAPVATTTAPVKAPTTSTTVVAKGAEPAATMKRERMAVVNYNDFAIKHERILETYSEIEDLEKTKDYLFKNCDILMHEHAQSYMLLSSLEDEMNGKHKRMKLVCRQSQILTHIHELGVSMKRDPRDVILPFFKRIEEAQYLQGFIQAVDDFIVKIQKRAVEKRKEMDEERRRKKAGGVKGGGNDGDEEEDEEEDDVEYEGMEAAAVGPGGLNPFEVLKSLPKAMRKAFESQNVKKLQEVLAAMDPEEAKHWMKQCVDSGLWVANDPTTFN